MIKIAGRLIPQTMATQHPDNVRPPTWERDGDGFVSVQEEVRECAASFIDLGCEEFMWDWEGKHVDEGVTEKLLTEYYDDFRKKPLGKERFLTFRVPNIWKEKGRSLARAFMSILTSEEFARDLRVPTPPLFEIIVPMAESADQMMWYHSAFSRLAAVKHTLFDEGRDGLKSLDVIPLIEGIHDMERVDIFLEEYRRRLAALHRQNPPYLRVFLARSDPALLSGLIPAVVGNRIALSKITAWSRHRKIPVFPWLGAGALPFRGHLRPDRLKHFIATYPGIRSVAIQSSFRYDFPITKVKKALQVLPCMLADTESPIFSKTETQLLERINRNAENFYQKTVQRIAGTINDVAIFVPRRRERRLHIGLLGYHRAVGARPLPRAIPFTAACYSLGIPPEFFGTGRALHALSAREKRALRNAYPTMEKDLRYAGEFLNKENLSFLAKEERVWKDICTDIQAIESFLGTSLGPHTSEGYIHRNWSSTLFFHLRRKSRDAHQLTKCIVESGVQRGSLG